MSLLPKYSTIRKGDLVRGPVLFIWQGGWGSITNVLVAVMGENPMAEEMEACTICCKWQGKTVYAVMAAWGRPRGTWPHCGGSGGACTAHMRVLRSLCSPCGMHPIKCAAQDR